jgi:transcriptional regulator with XRE-family HTH domain
MSIRFSALTRDFFYDRLACMDIGTVLAVARKRAEITQKDVALMLGISPQYLSDMEQGRRAFNERFLDKLPTAMRDEVRAAFIAEHEAAIERLTGNAQSIADTSL